MSKGWITCLAAKQTTEECMALDRQQTLSNLCNLLEFIEKSCPRPIYHAFHHKLDDMLRRYSDIYLLKINNKDMFSLQNKNKC